MKSQPLHHAGKISYGRMPTLLVKKAKPVCARKRRASQKRKTLEASIPQNVVSSTPQAVKAAAPVS